MSVITRVSYFAGGIRWQGSRLNRQLLTLGPYYPAAGGGDRWKVLVCSNQTGKGSSVSTLWPMNLSATERAPRWLSPTRSSKQAETLCNINVQA